MYNKKLIETLNFEQNELLKKINKSRENADYGTYKNLIRALTDIANLIHQEENYKPNTNLKIPMYYEYVYMENVQHVRIFFEGKFYNTLPNSYDLKTKIKDIIKDFDYSERDIVIYSLGKGSLYSILSELDSEINMIDNGILKGLAYKPDRKFYLKSLNK